MSLESILTNNKNRLNELISNANAVTGNSDTTIADAISSLLDGFGKGEGATTGTKIQTGTFTVGSNMTSGHQIIAYIEPWGFEPTVVVAWQSERSYASKMVNASCLVNMNGSFVRICSVGNSTGTGMSAASSTNDWTGLDQGFICLEYGNTLYLRAGTSRGIQAGEWNWVAIE